MEGRQRATRGDAEGGSSPVTTIAFRRTVQRTIDINQAGSGIIPIIAIERMQHRLGASSNTDAEHRSVARPTGLSSIHCRSVQGAFHVDQACNRVKSGVNVEAVQYLFFTFCTDLEHRPLIRAAAAAICRAVELTLHVDQACNGICAVIVFVSVAIETVEPINYFLGAERADPEDGPGVASARAGVAAVLSCTVQKPFHGK